VSEKQEQYPLSWPQDWPRTRLQEQKAMGTWKRTANQYRDELLKELERIKAPIAVISTNVPLGLRGQLQPGAEPRDVGVAIYFSKPMKEDFRWQDALGIHEPDPSEDRIQAAYKQRVVQHHPDRGGDVEMFRMLTQHRDTALRWINRKSAKPDFVIACDLYREVRLNLAAIAFTLKALRTIDRCGTSSVLERSFKGFMALAADAGPSVGVAR
jgi:hypothetical protein